MAEATPERCTATDASHRQCKNPSVEGAPFAVCPRHASELYRFIDESFRGYRSETAEGLAERIATESLCPDWKTRGHWVYYVQIGPYVKIGKSTYINSRLRNYPPGHSVVSC